MGDHLCLALRFLCDGMIYFSWGLINGFSSKVAFAINNETPRKQFFCFDVGLHVILYCPSFSDWNKVCVDRCCTFAKMNHSAFFFFLSIRARQHDNFRTGKQPLLFYLSA